MPAPRRLIPIALSLSILLAACGGEEVDPPVGVTDAEYFGLTLGSCTELRGGLGGGESMTVGVEAEDEALGFPAKKLRYRLGGNLRRTDFVTAEDGQLLLHRREVTDPETRTNLQWDFDPPILWMERPIVPTGAAPLVTETEAVDGEGGRTPWSARVIINQLGSVETSEGAVEAYPLLVITETATSRHQDRLWVEPETGFVRMDLDGEAWPDFTLYRRWVMGPEDLACVAPQS